jgi:hypothetical protein
VDYDIDEKAKHDYPPSVVDTNESVVEYDIDEDT